jgi:hypothetical protein
LLSACVGVNVNLYAGPLCSVVSGKFPAVKLLGVDVTVRITATAGLL